MRHIGFFAIWMLGIVAIVDCGKLRASFGFNNLTIDWRVNYFLQDIILTINFSELNDPEQIFIGFSDHGELSNIDGLLCKKKGPSIDCEDVSIDESYHIVRDISQDWTRLRVSAEAEVWKRKISTCDPKDYAFEPGTTQFILAVAWNTHKLKSLRDKRWQMEKRFGKIIETEEEPIVDIMEKDAKEVIIKARKPITIPDVETTYQCIIQRMPIDVTYKHHIVRMDSYVQKGNEHLVHHMEVFMCNENVGSWSGSCNDPAKPRAAKSCSHVIGAWAMGEGPIVYPKDAGLPIGGDWSSEGGIYIMVEIHYNNPERLFGYEDNSGFRLWITPSIRKYDAGIMELGQIYSDVSAIPPQEKEWALTGYCLAPCTEHFPEDGINIFGSQLHAHLTGARLWTSLYRNGVKIGEVNRDNHYSPHWQHLQQVRPYLNVKPGDVLTTTCVYDSRNRTKFTFGGYGITDEMCVNYIYYFPASRVEVCKSSISNHTLRGYFKSRYGIADLDTPIQDLFTSVKSWDFSRLHELHSLYSTANQNMHCFQGDGNPLPLRNMEYGTRWDHMSQPELYATPFTKSRDRFECPAINDYV